jgi:hypothetical protein
VTARSNTSIFLPPQIPDLIGVEERRYLDHTGLVRHRGIGDLMRYSALVQDVSALDRYDSPPPRAETSRGERYSDEQLYALALYLYSLRPPPNPNRFDATAARGQVIFQHEGCAACHAPPLYTNNKLIPVEGFEPPADHKQQFDLMETRVGTDPRYSLETHKGTGYYKVPSLKGVWYRGPFEHNGSIATLEDWFDSARLRDDYVPTGFKGYDGGARSVKGHPSAWISHLRRRGPSSLFSRRSDVFPGIPTRHRRFVTGGVGHLPRQAGRALMNLLEAIANTERARSRRNRYR